MITPKSTGSSWEPFALKMDTFHCLKNSPALPSAVMQVVEKVIRVVMIPFALIADFVINAVRIFANLCMSIVNVSRGPPAEGGKAPPKKPEKVESEDEEEGDDLEARESKSEGVSPESSVITSTPSSEASPEPVAESPSTASSLPAVLAPDASSPSSVSTSASSSSSSTATLAAPHTTTAGSSLPPPPSVTPTRSAIPAPPPESKKAPGVQQIPLPSCSQDSAVDTGLRSQIGELITQMENGVIKHRKTLKALGLAVKDVHPLTFLSVAVSSNELRVKFRSVLDDRLMNTVVRDAFFNSEKAGPTFKQKLDQAMPLEQYLDDFEAKTKITKGSSRPFVQRRDWEGLVDHLVAEPKAKKKKTGLFGH